MGFGQHWEHAAMGHSGSVLTAWNCEQLCQSSAYEGEPAATCIHVFIYIQFLEQWQYIGLGTP